MKFVLQLNCNLFVLQIEARFFLNVCPLKLSTFKFYVKFWKIYKNEYDNVVRLLLFITSDIYVGKDTEVIFSE